MTRKKQNSGDTYKDATGVLNKFNNCLPDIFYGVYYGKYLTRAKSKLLPLSELPAATILPSDWMPRARA